MNNQQVNINGLVYPVQNPTVYYPDAVIGKYCVERGTDANAEVTSRTQAGIPIHLALQDLLVRSVRHEESLNYRKSIAAIAMCLTVLRQMNELSLSDVAINALANYFIGGFFLRLAYDIITAITDRLGVNVQYSM